LGKKKTLIHELVQGIIALLPITNRNPETDNMTGLIYIKGRLKRGLHVVRFSSTKNATVILDYSIPFPILHSGKNTHLIPPPLNKFLLRK
jgi:hypothetical protein